MAIVKIKHRGLRELFETGRSSRIGRQYQENATLILDYLDRIKDLKDCAGVKDFHPLKGDRVGQYPMHVAGDWCITFSFDGKDVTIIGFEDYHK